MAAAALVFGFCCTTAATEPKPAPLDCKLGFEGIMDLVKRLPSAEVTETEEWDMVKVDSASTSENDWWIAQHVFTKPQHYAYPTVTRRMIWKDASGAVLSERSACGYGPKPQFEKVMREFEDLDRAMNEAIEKEHRQKTNP